MSNTLHTPPPELDWLESGLPVSTSYNDPYFCLKNGIAESDYVFLQHNLIPQRWQEPSASCFSVLETGFGTGLNFLNTWRRFDEQASDHQWLHFTSIEKYPLNANQLQKSLAIWPELSEFLEQLLQHYPDTLRGFHHLQWPKYRVRLTLIFADVLDGLTQLSSPYDAFFLDGFSPEKNPEMWSHAVFQQLRRLAQFNPNCTFSTFTADRHVQNGMTSAGFSVETVPGLGSKGDMLRGQYQCTQGPEQPIVHHNKPWLCRPALRQQRTAIVIGAGLAGATTARALAERGFTVTVIDRQGIAQGASGNPQGGLYINIAADPNAMHTQFYLAAQRFATQHIRHHLGPSHEEHHDWQQCGVLQLAYDEKESQRQQRLQRLGYPPTLFHPVSTAEASQIAGIELRCGGLFFPNAGWVSPLAYCQALLRHDNITLRLDTAISLTNQVTHWSATGSKSHYQAAHVVLANAIDSQALLPEWPLPIKRIRGQLSILDAQQWHSPKTVLCARGYMPPALNGLLCLGATYNLQCDEPNVRNQDHQTNLAHGSDFGCLAKQEDNGISSVISGRVGFRCTTSDYLPIVGPLCNRSDFIQRFAQLQRNAQDIPATELPWQQGLWVNIGHGSKGLSSAALCAELIAADINGESQSISNAMREALLPVRFVLRDLRRGKIPEKERQPTVSYHTD